MGGRAPKKTYFDNSHTYYTAHLLIINENKTKEKESKVKEIKKRNKRFTPTLVDDIRHYCRERKNDVDPVRFYNFYEAKGWMIGKNKMKDWKAAVRTWEEKKTTTATWRPS